MGTEISRHLLGQLCLPKQRNAHTTKEYNDLVLKNKNDYTWGFPGGAVVKNPPANAGDMGSIPGPGRSHVLRSN